LEGCVTVRALTIYCLWATADDLIAPLAALVALNVEYLRAHPNTPKLYESGIRYQREGVTKSGRQKEKWLTWPLMLILRKADCEDLAAARASELRLAGTNAIAIAVESSIGYHIVVRMPDGTIEDPSRKLGMGEDKDG
jgi:hypothetical protein